mmetsp:Transcript_42092/g.139896  ORF Transcript_42092/g.139896 Transcript_42092/m.139896 type:complete len:323 (-) Transcript_42092:24-992(-)
MKGTVTIWSTVLCSESKVSGKSRKTSGCESTYGVAPAVVASMPASCLKLTSETAVVDPPSVLRRLRRASHSSIACGRVVDGSWTWTCEHPTPLRRLLALDGPAPLIDQVLELLGRADREAPVSLWRPVPEPAVRLALEVLPEHVENGAQRVEGRPVEALKDGGANLEGVLAALVHAREGVRRTARLDVRLDHRHARAVLCTQRATSEAAHARADHDHVVLVLQALAAEAVARARVRRLLVPRVERHVVAEGHHLVPLCVFDLLDVVARLALDVQLHPRHDRGRVAAPRLLHGRRNQETSARRDGRQHGKFGERDHARVQLRL